MTWIASVAFLLMTAALVIIVLPQKAEAASLKDRLRVAQQHLKSSQARLSLAEAALAAAVGGQQTTQPAMTTDPAMGATTTADPAATSLAQLQAEVADAQHAVRRWKRTVHRLKTQFRTQLRMAEWERQGKWMPIIEIAAAQYHVKADGIYRMMIRESGGQRMAGANTAFKGLFQYWTGTWSASWNPWRHDSIYDGSSQIFATCYAVSRGWGAQFWTTTWASQY